MLSNGTVQISLPSPKLATADIELGLASPRDFQFAAKDLQTTESTDSGITSKTAMVITASSHPGLPPNRGSREVMRNRYARTASAPPITPEYETTSDPSRMGAEHRVLVAFCDATSQSA